MCDHKYWTHQLLLHLFREEFIQKKSITSRGIKSIYYYWRCIFSSMSEKSIKEFGKNSRKNAWLLLEIEESVRLCGQDRAVVERAKISLVSTHKNKTIEGEPATYPKVAFKNRPSFEEEEEDPYIFLALFLPSFSSLPFYHELSAFLEIKFFFLPFVVIFFFFFFLRNKWSTKLWKILSIGINILPNNQPKNKVKLILHEFKQRKIKIIHNKWYWQRFFRSLLILKLNFFQYLTWFSSLLITKDLI